MMEKRILGRTGAELSVIGFGGTVVRDVSPTDAAGYVTRAIERGINYLEFFVAARKRGLIRHIGFSAHSEAAALRLLKAFPFDSMLLPVNLFCWRDGGFGQQACRAAVERGTGILALKALAKRPMREREEKKKILTTIPRSFKHEGVAS
jgi:predicted aldo/keto reductase-like oxidoreductase